MRSLVSAPPAVRGLVACGLTLGASSLWQSHSMFAAVCLFAMVLVSVDRNVDHATDGPLNWVSASNRPAAPRRWQRLRAALSAHRWLDLTAPIGFVAFSSLLLSCALAARVLPEQRQSLLLTALFALPLWTTATRLHVPWDGERDRKSVV